MGGGEVGTEAWAAEEKVKQMSNNNLEQEAGEAAEPQAVNSKDLAKTEAIVDESDG